MVVAISVRAWGLYGLGVLAVSGGWVGVAQAHEFLLKPDTFTFKKSEAVPVHAMASHVFMVSEEMEPPEDVVLTLKQGKHTSTLKKSKDEKGLQLNTTVTLQEAGPAWLLGHRLGQVWSMTTQGIKSGARQALQAQGQTVKESTRYEKFAKTYLNGALTDAAFVEVAGQKLEIVPLAPALPTAFNVGDELRFKVLYDSKPLSTAVWATYDGFSKHANTYAYYTEPDEQGIVHVKITAPGIWMVRAAHTVKTGSDVDAHSVRATLVFDVK